MRIIHVVEASFAGVGRHVLDLAEIQSQAHEVSIIYGTQRISDAFRKRIEAAAKIQSFPVDIARNIGLSDLAAFKSCKKIISDINPDVVHGHSSKGGVVARLCAPKSSSVYYTPNAIYTMNPDLSPVKRTLILLIEKMLSYRTTGIIAVSPEERDHIIKLGVAEEKITLIPNGIEAPYRHDKLQVRESLGLSKTATLIGFVGRVDQQKSPNKIIEIFKKLSAGKNTRLVVVGEGPMLQEMKAYAVVCGIEESVDWLGYQDGVWSMCAFDVFLLPSRYEGFPYVLLEANGLGIPIVTSDRSNASQLIEQGVNGYIVPYDDENGFVECINKAIEISVNTTKTELQSLFLAASMEKAVTALYAESTNKRII